VKESLGRENHSTAIYSIHAMRKSEKPHIHAHIPTAMQVKQGQEFGQQHFAQKCHSQKSVRERQSDLKKGKSSEGAGIFDPKPSERKVKKDALVSEVEIRSEWTVVSPRRSAEMCGERNSATNHGQTCSESPM
jgi:hypothetical protein